MDDDVFAHLMASLGLAALEWSRGVAVGVSGGADSTALALLLHAWTQARNIPFLALVCDHGLRPESASEARQASMAMESQGIPSRILSLEMNAGPSIQERARTARYDAILQVMRQEDIGILAVGHHSLDQAETVEHRIQGGATAPSALAGMLPVRVADDALLVRPLLSCEPGVLRSYLRDRSISWIEDPSNQDARYARVAIRNRLRQDQERVAVLLSIAADNKDRLRVLRTEAASRLVGAGRQMMPGGASHLAWPDRLGSDAPAAEAIRMMVRDASGNVPVAPDSSFIRLASGGGGTLSGAALWKSGKAVWISRELSCVPCDVHAVGHGSWDGRIRLAPDPNIPADARLGALGEAAASVLRKRQMSALPHRVLACMPCVRRRDEVLAIPQLGVGLWLPLADARRPEPCIDRHPSLQASIFRQ
jgi:tRNA(Ile)-lysidine synthase